MSSIAVPEGAIREAISLRAASDKAFRTALLAAPKASIESFLGTSLPDNLEVVVVEDTAAVTHVAIPVFNAELSDEQLEAVAGGTSGLQGGTHLTTMVQSSPGSPGGILQSGTNNVSCIGKGGLVNSSLNVSAGGHVSG